MAADSEDMRWDKLDRGKNVPIAPKPQLSVIADGYLITTFLG